MAESDDAPLAPAEVAARRWVHDQLTALPHPDWDVLAGYLPDDASARTVADAAQAAQRLVADMTAGLVVPTRCPTCPPPTTP